MADEALVAELRAVAGSAELRCTVDAWRRAGERVALVPTMGALHRGHLSLIEIARRRADRVVASIFVNPTQFNAREDLERYPRTPAADTALLAGAGCDLLYLPTPEMLYPEGHSVTVEPGSAAQGLEGDHRPGHFRGVATVVTLLFNLVRPDVAVFGQKDAQQLAVVEQIVRDLHLPIEIIPGPTVREADGLALSSRNRFLEPDERRAASVLYRALTAAHQKIIKGERSAAAIRGELSRVLASEPRARIDYAEVVDAVSFRPTTTITGPIVLPIAAAIGDTRLIDSFAIDPETTDSKQASATDREIPCNA